MARVAPGRLARGVSLGALAVALVGLAAGKPAETAKGEAGEAGETAAQVVELDTRGFRFTPQEVTVARGQPVRFVVTAVESPHAFSIPDLEFEQVVLPGEPGIVELTFEAAGAVAFRCRFHHRQGMVGTIRVVEPAAAPPEER
jgi:cytochrome c oxidase subunit 2